MILLIDHLLRKFRVNPFLSTGEIEVPGLRQLCSDVHLCAQEDTATLYHARILHTEFFFLAPFPHGKSSLSSLTFRAQMPVQFVFKHSDGSSCQLTF